MGNAPAALPRACGLGLCSRRRDDGASDEQGSTAAPRRARPLRPPQELGAGQHRLRHAVRPGHAGGAVHREAVPGVPRVPQAARVPRARGLAPRRGAAGAGARLPGAVLRVHAAGQLARAPAAPARRAGRHRQQRHLPAPGARAHLRRQAGVAQRGALRGPHPVEQAAGVRRPGLRQRRGDVRLPLHPHPVRHEPRQHSVGHHHLPAARAGPGRLPHLEHAADPLRRVPAARRLRPGRPGQRGHHRALHPARLEPGQRPLRRAAPAAAGARRAPRALPAAAGAGAGGAAAAPDAAVVRRAGAALVRAARRLQHAARDRRAGVPRGALQRLVHEQRDRHEEPVRRAALQRAAGGGPAHGAGHAEDLVPLEGQGRRGDQRGRAAQLPGGQSDHRGPPRGHRVLREAHGERDAHAGRLPGRLGVDRAAHLGQPHARLPPGDGQLPAVPNLPLPARRLEGLRVQGHHRHPQEDLQGGGQRREDLGQAHGTRDGAARQGHHPLRHRDGQVPHLRVEPLPALPPRLRPQGAVHGRVRHRVPGARDAGARGDQHLRQRGPARVRRELLQGAHGDVLAPRRRRAGRAAQELQATVQQRLAERPARGLLEEEAAAAEQHGQRGHAGRTAVLGVRAGLAGLPALLRLRARRGHAARGAGRRAHPAHGRGRRALCAGGVLPHLGQAGLPGRLRDLLRGRRRGGGGRGDLQHAAGLEAPEAPAGGAARAHRDPRRSVPRAQAQGVPVRGALGGEPAEPRVQPRHGARAPGHAGPGRAALPARGPRGRLPRQPRRAGAGAAGARGGRAARRRAPAPREPREGRRRPLGGRRGALGAAGPPAALHPAPGAHLLPGHHGAAQPAVPAAPRHAGAGAGRAAAPAAAQPGRAALRGVEVVPVRDAARGAARVPVRGAARVAAAGAAAAAAAPLLLGELGARAQPRADPPHRGRAHVPQRGRPRPPALRRVLHVAGPAAPRGHRARLRARGAVVPAAAGPGRSLHPRGPRYRRGSVPRLLAAPPAPPGGRRRPPGLHGAGVRVPLARPGPHLPAGDGGGAGARGAQRGAHRLQPRAGHPQDLRAGRAAHAAGGRGAARAVRVRGAHVRVRGRHHGHRGAADGAARAGAARRHDAAPGRGLHQRAARQEPLPRGHLRPHVPHAGGGLPHPQPVLLAAGAPAARPRALARPRATKALVLIARLLCRAGRGTRPPHPAARAGTLPRGAQQGHGPTGSPTGAPTAPRWVLPSALR